MIRMAIVENLKKWCVYCHTNKVNGKKYIGITSQKPATRWNNGEGYKRCPRFYNAIKHYGWDMFRHDILYTGLTKEAAERLEIELIAKYQTQNPKFGYNLASGGLVNSGWSQSEEAKKNLSEIHTGKPRTAETKEKISKTIKKKWENKKFSQNMSNAMKRHWENDECRMKISGANNCNAREVICVETNKIYGSMTEAQKDTGIHHNNIYQVCCGKRQTAGGYHWKYAEAVSTSA